jgi:hypothetical protein
MNTYMTHLPQLERIKRIQNMDLKLVMSFS